MLDRVPYDIFRKIIRFSYARSSFHFFSTFNEINPPPTRATHVCRSWRTALLSDPTMWTYIEITDGMRHMSLDELYEKLARSESAPLHVVITSGWFWLDSLVVVGLYRTLAVISQEMYRCRRLQVFIQPQLASLVSSCLDAPVPLLEEFCFNVTKDEANYRRKDILRGVHDLLFDGIAPHLKHVSLQISSEIMDIVQLTMFQNLTTLQLYMNPGSESVVDGDMLLNIIQLSPCLRVLDISWQSMDSKIGFVMPSSRRISLPYLQHLTLCGCQIDFVDLVLGHLDLPTENLEFTIQYTYYRYEFSNSTFLSHFFLTHRPLTYISLFIPCVTGLYTYLRESINQAPCTGSSVLTEFRGSSLDDDFPMSFRTFNLSYITHMRLQLPYFLLKPETLRNLFVSMPNLQHLFVEHASYKGYYEDPLNPIPRSSLTALIPPSEPLKHSGSIVDSEEEENLGSNTVLDDSTRIETYHWQGQPIPCPSLRRFVSIFPQYPSSVIFEETHLRELVRCSNIREEAGHPLEIIVSCYRKGLTFELDSMVDWLGDYDELDHSPVDIVFVVDDDVDEFVGKVCNVDTDVL